MIFLPYRKLLVSSNLNVDSVRSNLNSFAELKGLENNQWYNNIFKKTSKRYIGTISGNSFKLEPLVTYSRTPFLIIKGVFSEQNDKSNIEIKLAIPIEVKIAFLLIVVTGIFILGTDYVIKKFSGSLTIIEEFPYILFLPLVLYLIVMILFNVQTRSFMQRFFKHFEIDKN